MKKNLILYVPVIHAGYIRLLDKYWNRVYEDQARSVFAQDHVRGLYVIGKEFISEFCVRKEIRAISADEAVEFLGVKYRHPWKVSVLDRGTLSEARQRRIITTGDELCRLVVDKYFSDQPVEYDTAFLRWDRASIFSQTPVNYDRVSSDSFDRKMMALAKGEAEKTSDWWRQVGSVVVKDGQIIYSAHNRHMPTEYQSYMVGDPRDFVKAGECSELCSAIHSEQDVIAWAAREGTSLFRTHIYVNVFPCPICAKLIAASGISRLYFAEGHASLDGEAVLKEAGVEIVLVK